MSTDTSMSVGMTPRTTKNWLAAPAPSVGVLLPDRHRLPARVYYADTDAGEIVYHAKFLDFAERGRTEFLRLLGYPSPVFEAANQFFVVRTATVDFLSPAKLDDAINIDTMIGRLGGSSVDLVTEIRRDDTTICGLKLMMVMVNGVTMKPVRIPDALRSALMPYMVAAP
jgi:acyl-CoA thioester hydrolase